MTHLEIPKLLETEVKQILNRQIQLTMMINQEESHRNWKVRRKPRELCLKLFLIA